MQNHSPKPKHNPNADDKQSTFDLGYRPSLQEITAADKSSKKRRPQKPRASRKGATLGQRLASKTKRLRAKFSLRGYVTTMVVASVLLAATFAGYSAFSFQYEKSLKDAWAIMYLEGERLANSLSQELNRHPFKPGLNAEAAAVKSFRTPDAVMVWTDDKAAKSITGDLPPFTARDMGYRTIKFSESVTVLKIDGKVYVARRIPLSLVKKTAPKAMPQLRYIGLWKFSLDKWAESRGIDRFAENGLYIVTSGGTLLASLDPKVNQQSLRERALVNAFLSSQLSTADLSFNNSEGVASYGFFAEVDSTNLVLFRENTKTATIETVVASGKTFVFRMLALLCAAIVILQWPLRGITGPIRELVVLAREVSRGNFKVVPKKSGFGEIVSLSDTFASMAKNLVQRENAINELMKEQREKIRMEREFAVAKSVQDNFIPKAPLDPDSGLTLASLYVPAAQVAGDWFSFSYQSNARESIVVLADVSGHDMAASMFTAIIAGIFNDIRESHPDGFPTEEFCFRLNRTIFRFGRRKWHATMQLLKYVHMSGEATITNCGHTSPFVFRTGMKPIPITLRSTPIGMEPEPNPCSKTIVFDKDTTLLMYTDGITETRKADRSVYGQKRLLRLGDSIKSRPVFDILQTIKRDQEAFAAGKSADDDICLLAMRPVQ